MRAVSTAWKNAYPHEEKPPILNSQFPILNSHRSASHRPRSCAPEFLGVCLGGTRSSLVQFDGESPIAYSSGCFLGRNVGRNLSWPFHVLDYGIASADVDGNSVLE